MPFLPDVIAKSDTGYVGRRTAGNSVGSGIVVQLS